MEISDEDEDSKFKQNSNQIVINPSHKELPISPKNDKPYELKWGIKLSLNLLLNMEIKVCCLERNSMLEIGEFSFIGRTAENRSFDLIPIN